MACALTRELEAPELESEEPIILRFFFSSKYLAERRVDTSYSHYLGVCHETNASATVSPGGAGASDHCLTSNNFAADFDLVQPRDNFATYFLIHVHHITLPEMVKMAAVHTALYDSC